MNRADMLALLAVILEGSVTALCKPTNICVPRKSLN